MNAKLTDKSSLERPNMPVMLRTSKKLEELAYKILGTPDNLQKPKKSKTFKEKEQDARIEFEESVRQR